MITRRRRKAVHASQEWEYEEEKEEVHSTITTLRRRTRRRKRDELLSADADLLLTDHRAQESLNCTIKSSSKIIQITNHGTRQRNGLHRIQIKSRSLFSGLVFLLLTIIGLNEGRQDTITIASAFYTQPTRTLTPSSITTKTRRRRTTDQSPKDFILHANFFNDNNNNNQQQLYTHSPLSPLKVMLFVDGTWLYYSIYEREYVRDIVAHKYGKDWKNHYTIDWSVIPMVACRALLQDKKSSWSAILAPTAPEPNDPSPSSYTTNQQPQTQRPVEISRVMVYSSMRRETPTTTFRYRMFSDMADAGFDVNMMEQISGSGGGREKCVDIQLAVDMLYYATVPDAYDVALLLTGDKDFLPAVVRCRQKGRRVGLVSMRSAASQSFTDTPNLLDYNTIWIEDYIDEWVREMTPEQKAKTRPSSYENRKGILHSSSPQQPQQIGQRWQGVSYDHKDGISPYVLERVVADFVAESAEPKVSIRDIGREIKSLTVNGIGLLAEVKRIYGGLYQFLVLSEIFDVTGSAGHFFVALEGDQRFVDSKLEEKKKKATLTADELKFLSEYAERPKKPRDVAYEFTLVQRDPTEGRTSKPPSSNMAIAEVDFDSHTVAMLKEKCRAAGLPVSGRKAELIERLQSHSKESRAASEDPAKRLERIVVEYLQATGGRASSRDIGRYLAANAASGSLRSQPQNQAGNRRLSALNEMKLLYGTLKTFISGIDYLEITYDLTGGSRIEGEFDVILPKEKKNSSKEMLASSA